GGATITAETHRQRMRTVRAFFERIIDWDWPDAPARNPVIAGDIPGKPEPLPEFPGDPGDRLVVELLARTGMRAGELAGLEADAVVQIGAGHWLRIPLGKLRNDRYVPPACPACTRTGCGTPWPPGPSTAACGSRPSPRCSGTRRWR